MGESRMIHEIQYAVVYHWELYEMEICQVCHDFGLSRLVIDFRAQNYP